MTTIDERIKNLEDGYKGLEGRMAARCDELAERCDALKATNEALIEALAAVYGGILQQSERYGVITRQVEDVLKFRALHPRKGADDVTHEDAVSKEIIRIIGALRHAGPTIPGR